MDIDIRSIRDTSRSLLLPQNFHHADNNLTFFVTAYFNLLVQQQWPAVDKQRHCVLRISLTAWGIKISVPLSLCPARERQ